MRLPQVVVGGGYERTRLRGRLEGDKCDKHDKHDKHDSRDSCDRHGQLTASQTWTVLTLGLARAVLARS